MGWLADLLQEIPVSAALKAKLEKLEADYEKLKTDLEKEKTENKKLKDQLAQFQPQGALAPEEIAIIKLLSQHGGRASAHEISGQLQMHPTKAMHFINRLEEAEYLWAAHNYLSGSSYGLGPKGQEYAVVHWFV